MQDLSEIELRRGISGVGGGLRQFLRLLGVLRRVSALKQDCCIAELRLRDSLFGGFAVPFCRFCHIDRDAKTTRQYFGKQDLGSGITGLRAWQSQIVSGLVEATLIGAKCFIIRTPCRTVSG